MDTIPRLPKVFETAEAVKDGADEVDMVINMGWVKDREYGRITQEIRSVKEAAGSPDIEGNLSRPVP